MSLQILKSSNMLSQNPHLSLLFFQANNRPLIEFQVAKPFTCTISDHYICPNKHKINIRSRAVLLYRPLMYLQALWHHTQYTYCVINSHSTLTNKVTFFLYHFTYKACVVFCQCCKGKKIQHPPNSRLKCNQWGDSPEWHKHVSAWSGDKMQWRISL